MSSTLLVSPPRTHRDECETGASVHSRSPKAPSFVAASSFELDSVRTYADRVTRDVARYTEPDAARNTPNMEKLLKSYDYRVPIASSTIAEAPTSSAAAGRSQKKSGKLLLTPQSISSQSQIRAQIAAERAKGSRHVPSVEGLYRNLPYTWRDLVPFSVPVRHPEVMSSNALGYHSAVVRQTNDTGLRIIDERLLSPWQREQLGSCSAVPNGALDGFALHLCERGVREMSLRKHSLAHKMESLATYPGVAQLVGMGNSKMI